MNGETPRFSFGEEKDSEIYSSAPSLYTLLKKYYKNKTELLIKNETKKHLSSFSKSYTKKKDISSTFKQQRNGTPEPYYGQFTKFLMKRFHLRNDYDKQHADEFLSSKEQAFKFPSRNDDIID